MRLISPDFDDGQRIPARYTCAGADISPPLRVEAVPDRARSLALVVDDPDAPRGPFDHWLIWNLPADLSEIPEGVAAQQIVDDLGTALQGENDFGRIGYGGPCPPGTRPHRYRFHLYALDGMLEVEPGATRERLERALDGRVVDEAELIGLYGREG